MKKMNYEKPVADFIDTNEDDIITASFSKSVREDGIGVGLALNDGNFEAGVENGTIKLK